MNLVEEKNRKELLIQFGFSQEFLEAIDAIKSIDKSLSYVMNYPEGAYYYLPTIANYSIYRGYKVVPICDSGQGDSFYTFLFNDTEQKIIYNEIERDEVYANFGLNTNALIASILIEYYDLMDDEEVEDRVSVVERISEIGFKLGVDKEITSNFMQRVFDAEDYNEDRFSHSRKWFGENIVPLLK
jgi:hypothetical protein